MLDASGYRYSSSVTANRALTHLPFQLDYNRENTAETPIYEFPVTIEAVTLTLPQHIAGLGLSVPSGWTYRASEPADLKLAIGESGVLIAEAQGTVTPRFTAR